MGHIGGHGARWGMGPWGPWVERGKGGASEAERAERAGVHWGPLKSFDWV